MSLSSYGSEEYLSASASGSRGSGSASPASSVDSEDLQELLDELQIVPPCDSQRPATAIKRRFVLDSDSDADSLPTSTRPHSSPRLETGGGTPAAAVTAPAAGSCQPLPPPASVPTSKAAVQQAAEPEVIEILDSSDSDSEDDWKIAAPSTATKRWQVVDSDDSEDDEQSGAPGQPAELPPYFAAIPSLAATQAVPPPKAQPRRHPQPGAAAAAAPPRQQQSAAPGQETQQQTAALPALPASTARPLSASAFKRQRDEMTRQLFQEFNRTVFEGRLPANLEVSWNSRLLTTAGLTHYRRDIPDDPYAPPIYTARVELSSKVLDGFGKLERTLCHELCHVAAWLVDHIAKPPHGPVFKGWADKAMRLYTHLDITTCHAYEIFYPFRWQCSNTGCLQGYGRHSNSIDVAKKACGVCRAPLIFLGRFKADGSPAKQRVGNRFTQFVKENLSEVKAQLPAGTPQKALMQAVSAKYAAQRGGGGGGSQTLGGASSGGGASSSSDSLLTSLNLLG